MRNSLQQQLAKRDQQNLRQRLVVEKRRRQVIQLQQAGDLVNFASNDYLGLGQHPQLKLRLQQLVLEYGIGSGASQYISGYFEVHKACEQAFANYLHTEKALLFSSGYLANIGVINAFKELNCAIFFDKFCHASIIDGIQLSQAQHFRYAHNNLEHLHQRLSQCQLENKIIISESIFSMQGSTSNLAKLIELAKMHQAILIIDHAHGLGVLEPITIDYDLLLWICPLGKAMGSCGAVVAGSMFLIDYLTQFTRSLIYDTALPPAIAAINQEALQLVEKESWRQQKLFALIEHFQQLAQQLQIPISGADAPIQIIPCRDTKFALDLQSYLLKQGFFTFAARPPTVPAQQVCLRITLNCHHQFTDIKNLLNNIAQFYAYNQPIEKTDSATI